MMFIIFNKRGEIIGIKDFFKRKTCEHNDLEPLFCCSLPEEFYILELAVFTCINLISKTLAQCEFVVMRDGVSTKNDNYYLLNVEPNPNENSFEFWNRLIFKLMFNNEVVVIQNDKSLYIVDSWEKTEYSLKENIYRDITIKDLTLNKTFFENEVLNIKLNNKNIKCLIDEMYRGYSKIITSSINYTKRKSHDKGILTINTLFSQTDDANKRLKDLVENKFKQYFDPNRDSVLPLTEGLNLNIEHGTMPNTRDIKSLIDDVYEFVSRSFSIPIGLLKSDIVNQVSQTDNFLMFCINPLARMIEDELNRKIMGRRKYLNKSYIKIDTTRIKNIDISSMANSLDVLFRIGVNTINDNLKLLGREEIDEDYANMRFVTKNYELAQDITKKGGEKNT